MSNVALESLPVASLKPHPRNARTHSDKQIRQIARSIERFGFTSPVLVGADDTIIAGHGRVAAAKHIGLAEVPVVRLAHLSAAERRAYVIADNKLAEHAGWDRAALALELKELTELDFELELTGLDPGEITLVLEPEGDAAPPRTARQATASSREDVAPVVSRPGEVWLLGPHRLACGDHDMAACDRILRHFHAACGRSPVLAATGASFATVAAQRAQETQHGR